ncbi:MAG: hypothetical protein H6837_18970 [Planctomycetes bacterium]|nr:hypothetical protein [Planctomycetota bacterium]
MSCARTRRLSALSALLWLAACYNPPPLVEHRLQSDPELTNLNPSQIAVLAVEDDTPGKKLKDVQAAVRDELAARLPFLRYAPLGLVYVDGRAGRAAVAATTGALSVLEREYLSAVTAQFEGAEAKPDAILAVAVSHWDDSSLLINSRVRFSAKVALFGCSAGRVLWSGSLSGEVEAGGKGPAPRDPVARAESAAREFARAVVAQMPPRRS